MGKGTNRAYKVVPVDEDEPDFGDPPRNWGRVASMAGVWAVLLFGGFLVAPGFASGGGEEEASAREQASTTPRQAAARYLEAGLDGDADRTGATLCDDVSPKVLESDLVELRDDYDELLKSYPEVEISTSEPVASGSGMEIAVKVAFIGDSIFYENFTVTVLATGESYCVAQVVANKLKDEEDVADIDPQDQAARLLSSIFTVRDSEASYGYLCDDFEGPDPQDLYSAFTAWESRFGEATAIQSFEGDPMSSNVGTVVPMSVELSSGQAVESFSFEVTVDGDCVAALSEDGTLLEHSGN